jgi:hypothetical protein
VTEQLFCDVADCDDPENPGFARPVFRYGKCSSHCKQLQRTGETKAISEKLPLNEQMIEVYGLYAEADSDEEAARHRRHFFSLTKKAGRREVGEAIREALRRRQAAGLPIGRRPKGERERVVATFSNALEVVGASKAAEIAAREHGVSRRTVFRYLAVSQGKVLSPAVSAPRPQRAG